MISRTARYAVEATLCLAAEPDDGPVTSGTLAERLSLPPDYLSQVLDTLRRWGVVDSVRGRHGGFRLRRPASRITLLDVIEPFDDLDDERQCLLGRGECSDATACPVHDRWKIIAEAVATFFGQTTLAELQGLAKGQSPPTDSRSVQEESEEDVRQGRPGDEGALSAGDEALEVLRAWSEER